MQFIIVQITNEGDMLEADISASESGLQPSKPSFHLLLGPALGRDIVLTPAEGLRRIGFAVADQLKDPDELIRREAEGARSLILALPEDGQMVLRFDIGVSKADAMNALIDGGLARQKAVDQEPAKG